MSGSEPALSSTARGTAFFFKQVGGRTHAAGGRLDGRTWGDYPRERISTGSKVASRRATKPASASSASGATALTLQVRRVPEIGASVHLAVDPMGYISTLQLLDAPNRIHTGAGLERFGRRCYRPWPASSARLAKEPSRVRSEHVLMLAERWLAWVERSEARSDL